MSLIGLVGSAVVSLRQVYEVIVLRDGEASIRICDTEEEIHEFVEEETGETLPEE